ncbi:MAG: pilin [Candidatus Paceibacterota bacterium]
MKKLFSSILISFILFTNLVIPILVSAADPAVDVTGKTVVPENKSVYTMLAPIGNITCMDSSEENKISKKCLTNNIGEYLNVIFKLAIGICAALAVIMLILNGVKYMGDESIFGKTEAKSKMFGAIIGLLIALGAWALLNTINPALTGVGGLNISTAEVKLDPLVYGDTPHGPTNGKYCNGRVVAGAEVDTITGRRWDADSSERKILSDNGITVQRANSCKKVGESGCTSLTGLITSPVVNFKKSKCPSCVVVINGATECWEHSSGTTHFPGYSIVDIDDTPSMNTYVQSGTKQKNNSSFDLYIKDGIQFLYEKTHYHIIAW